MPSLEVLLSSTQFNTPLFYTLSSLCVNPFGSSLAPRANKANYDGAGFSIVLQTAVAVKQRFLMPPN